MKSPGIGDIQTAFTRASPRHGKPTHGAPNETAFRTPGGQPTLANPPTSLSEQVPMNAWIGAGLLVIALWICEAIVFLVSYRVSRGPGN